MDTDKDGQLTTEEMATSIAKDTKDAAKATAAEGAMAALDADKDGAIDTGELAAVVGSTEVAEAIVKKADTDKDGQLSLEEATAEAVASCPKVEDAANAAIVADAAKAMLCPDVLRGSLKTLGLGRGKIAAGWDSLAAIRHSVRLLETDTAHQQYRVSVPLGVAAGAAADEAVDVDIQRVKLPEQAATVHLERFLTEPTVRESFLHPSTLADTTKEPFTGRVCDRVPRAERAAFLRALDRAGMLAAMRARI